MFLVLPKVRILIYLQFLILSAFIALFWDELSVFFELLLRGINFKTFETGSLQMRLDYKTQIFDLISESLRTSLWGVGPAKELFVGELSKLRHPDSSLSVYLLRYGLLGGTLYLVPQITIVISLSLVLLKKSDRLAKSRDFIKVLLVLQIYLFLLSYLDPAFDDFKINIVHYFLSGIVIASIYAKKKFVNA
ncbi:hypothetical protein N9767_01230 [Planktomarina temperata]|nr:hypothetical protein [Planktomarina temperata]